MEIENPSYIVREVINGKENKAQDYFYRSMDLALEGLTSMALARERERDKATREKTPIRHQFELIKYTAWLRETEDKIEAA